MATRKKSSTTDVSTGAASKPAAGNRKKALAETPPAELAAPAPAPIELVASLLAVTPPAPAPPPIPAPGRALPGGVGDRLPQIRVGRGDFPTGRAIRATRRQIATRALWHYRRGSPDTLANWLLAEQEMGRVIERSHDLYRSGNADAHANWMRAIRELG